MPETPPDTSAKIWSSEVLLRNWLELSVGALPPPVALLPWHWAQFGAEDLVPDGGVARGLGAGRRSPEPGLANAVGDEADEQQHHEDESPSEVTVQAAFEPFGFERRRLRAFDGACQALPMQLGPLAGAKKILAP